LATRLRFTQEYQDQAVSLVRHSGRTIRDVARPHRRPAAHISVDRGLLQPPPATLHTQLTEFRCNLSAHISLHALESVDDRDERAQCQASYAALVASLNATFRTSIDGLSLCVRIRVSSSTAPAEQVT
jgi:hypothetical protein